MSRQCPALEGSDAVHAQRNVSAGIGGNLSGRVLYRVDHEGPAPAERVLAYRDSRERHSALAGPRRAERYRLFGLDELARGVGVRHNPSANEHCVGAWSTGDSTELYGPAATGGFRSVLPTL
jgi:hypothetical protein